MSKHDVLYIIVLTGLTPENISLKQKMLQSLD